MVGTFLPWASLDLGPLASGPARAFIDDHASAGFAAGWPGTVVLVAGALVVVAGIAVALWGGRASSLIVVTGAVIIVLAVIVAFTQLGSMVGDAEVDSRASFGEVASSVGLLVSAAGGVLSLVGGILLLARSAVRSREL